MAEATGMSQSAVSRIWRAFGLKPHTQEAFKPSTDPQFVEKVRDVPGTPERVTHDYISAGMLDLFAALAVAGPTAGQVITQIRGCEQRRDQIALR
jgi:hypothetical protein